MTMTRQHFNSLATWLSHIEKDETMTKTEIISLMGAWCSQWNPAFDFMRFQDYIHTKNKENQERLGGAY